MFCVVLLKDVLIKILIFIAKYRRKKGKI